MNKKVFFIILILFVLVLLLVLYFVGGFDRNKNTKTFPTPTPLRVINEGASPGVPFDEQLLKKEAQSFQVGLLIDKLPYQGKNFSLFYNDFQDQFVLYINPQNKEAGSSEFLEFIKQNGILSREWFENIFTTYITPTPAPQGSTSSPSVSPAP